MVVIDVFEIYIILSKDHQQIKIVAHQMFRDLRVRLTQIETINVIVSTHTVESSNIVLFLASYIIKYADRIGTSICRRYDSNGFTEGQVIEALHRCEKFLEILVLWLIQRLEVHIDVLESQSIGMRDEREQCIGLATIRCSIEYCANAVWEQFTVPCVYTFFLRDVIKICPWQLAWLLSELHPVCN